MIREPVPLGWQVEVVAVQAGELAPPGAGPGGGDQQQAEVGGGEPGGVQRHSQGLFGGDPHRFGDGVVVAASAALAADGVGRDEALVGGVAEDHREDLEDGGDGGGGVAAGAELVRPDVDRGAGDVAQRGGPPPRQDVGVGQAAVLGQGGGGEVEALEPGRGPLGQRDRAGVGVDELAAAAFGVDLPGFRFGGSLGGESGEGAVGAVVAPVANPPRAAA